MKTSVLPARVDRSDAPSRSTRGASLFEARDKALSVQGLRDREGQLLPLGCPIDALGSAGVAGVLFFRTSWTLIWMFLLAFIASIPALAENWRSQPGKSIAMRLALGTYAQQTERNMLHYHAEPSLCIALLFIVYLWYIARIERTTAIQVDRNYITPADFAVEVRDIPRHLTTTAELQKYFGKYGALAYVELALRSSKILLEREQLEQKARLETTERGRATFDLGGAHKALEAQMGKKLKATEAQMLAIEDKGKH
ncbi:hypothetical protein T492DRAFT_876336 [Pavlovales sp. CCMP2436]|nr:hypothetical protein T492DRAFT_876336 [Pavlovales sp. CCMP2436]